MPASVFPPRSAKALTSDHHPRVSSGICQGRVCEPLPRSPATSLAMTLLRRGPASSGLRRRLKREIERRRASERARERERHREDVKMCRCLDVKMRRCANVKMCKCEDEKM